jgi:hypothetical protein
MSAPLTQEELDRLMNLGLSPEAEILDLDSLFAKDSVDAPTSEEVFIQEPDDEDRLTHLGEAEEPAVMRLIPLPDGNNIEVGPNITDDEALRRARIDFPDSFKESSGTRLVTLPDGNNVEVGPNMTDEEALSRARVDFPQSFKAKKPSPYDAPFAVETDSGPLDALASNFYRAAWGLVPGVQAGLHAFTGDEEGYDEAQRKVIEVSKEANRIAPNLVALEEISDTYDNEGLLAASSKAMEFGAEAIFGSLGYMGPAAIAGGVVGGIAGLLAPVPGGALAGAIAGAGLGRVTASTLGMAAYTGTQFGNFMSSNMERAYEEGQVDTKDVNMAKQIASAGGQAALEAVTARLAGGFKFLGESEKRAVLGTVGRWLGNLDRSSGVKKVLAVMMEEEVAEIGQQALERYAAGLPVSPFNEDAAREYAHIAVASLAPSVGFGLVGAGTGKWNEVKAEKAKAKRKELSGDFIRINEDVNESVREVNGRRLEENASAVERKIEEIRNQRARLEVEINKQRLSGVEGYERSDRYKQFIREHAQLGAEQDALSARADLEQSLIDDGRITHRNIVTLLSDRNILWDDEAAFMMLTKRVTGKSRLDQLEEGSKELLKLYKYISRMPRQEVETRLAITSDDLAIELARKIKGQKDPTQADLVEVLGIEGDGLTKEQIGVIANAYRIRMHQLGLTRYQEGKPSEKLFNGKLPVSKDVYKQIIADTETSGRFPLLADLEKYGVKTNKAYERLRAYAVVNRDIALENDIFVPALDVGVKPRFRLELDGQRTDQVFTSQEAADAAAQNIYDDETARRDAARERENIPSVRGMVPEAVREPDSQSSVAVIREEAIEPAEVVSRYKYDVAKKKRRHWVIRRDDEIVKIESSEAKANNWIEGQKAGTARFDFTVNGELVSSHKKWSDGQTAKKNWLESITTSAYDTAHDKFIADNESGWRLGETSLERQANEAGSLAAKAAERDARDHNRLDVNRKAIPAAAYSADEESGYLLKESRVKESGRQGSFRPIGVYDSEAKAKDEAARRLRKKEGAEVWAGRKTRGRKKAIESRMKRRGERAYAERQIPMPAAPAVETGPVQGPELPPVLTEVDERIPMPAAEDLAADPAVSRHEEEKIPTEKELEAMSDERLRAEIGRLSVRRSLLQRELAGELDPSAREASASAEQEMGADIEGIVAVMDQRDRAEEELSPERSSSEPEGGPSQEADTKDTPDPDSRLVKIARKYGFINPVPEEATLLVDHHERRGSKRSAVRWGEIPYNADGKPGTPNRVVVPVGYTEGGLRGFGAAALDDGNASIQLETNERFTDWKELLGGFFGELEIDKKRKSKNIHVKSDGTGRVSYIWDDPAFENPVTIVFDLDPVTRNYNVVVARPSRDFLQPPGSNDALKNANDIHGPNPSADAMIAYLGKDVDHSFSESERTSHGLTEPRTRQTPAQKKAVEEILPKSSNDGRTLFQQIFSWDRGVDSKSREDRIDKYRSRFLDQYQRLLRNEMRAATKEGRDFVELLSYTSAHSAAMNRDTAGIYQKGSMDTGYPVYIHGVSIIGEYERDLDPSSRTYNEYLKNPDGSLVAGDGMKLDNRAPIPEGMFFTHNGVEYGKGKRETIELDIYSDGAVGGFETLLEPIAVGDGLNLIDQFFQYAIARRAKRLSSEGKVVPFTDLQIREGLRLAELHPEILVVYENYQRWNDGLVDFAISSGRISSSEGKVWKDYHDYVPFFPEDEMSDHTDHSMVLGMQPGLLKKGKIHKLEGHEKDLMQPAHAVSKNTMFLIEHSLANIASNRALRDALILETARSLPGSPKVTNPETHLSTWIEGEQVWFDVDDRLLHEALTGSLVGMHPYTGWLSKPARWTRELVTRGPEFMMANMLRDTLSVWVTNQGDYLPVKDTFHTFAKNLKGMKKGVTTQEYKELVRQGHGARYELGATGRGGDYRGGSLDNWSGQKHLFVGKSKKAVPQKRALKKLWDGLGQISQFSEMATRERVYASVYRKTKARLENAIDPETGVRMTDQAVKLRAMGEASHQAREILNFSRRGNNPWLRLLAGVTPFLNARLQGMDQIGRNFAGLTAVRGMDEKTGKFIDQKAVRRAMIWRGLFLSGLTGMLTALNYDDEDYDRQRSEVKNDYWLVPIGGGRFFSMPIPFEAGVLFKVLPELATTAMLDSIKHGSPDGRKIVDSIKRNVSVTLNLNPFGGAMPTFARPFVEQATNFNLFTRRPIVPFYMEGMGKYAYRPKTSALARVAGEWTGANPLLAENWQRHLFPGLASIPIGLLDEMIRAVDDSIPGTGGSRWVDKPLLRRFIKDDAERGLAGEFYELNSTFNDISKTLNHLETKDPEESLKFALKNRDLLSLEPVIKDMRKSMSRIRSERNAVIDSDELGRSSKRDRLDSLIDQENVLLKDIGIIRRMANLPIDWKPW